MFCFLHQGDYNLPSLKSHARTQPPIFRLMSFCSKIICILLFWDLPDLLMTIANGSRTRWKDFLFPVQRVSLEAFQLCALAKTQQWNPHSPPATIITVKHFSKWKDFPKSKSISKFGLCYLKFWDLIICFDFLDKQLKRSAKAKAATLHSCMHLSPICVSPDCLVG